MAREDGATVESFIDNSAEDVQENTAETDIPEENVGNGEQEEQEQKSADDIGELKQRLMMTEQQLEYFRELLRQNQDIIALYKGKQEQGEEKDPLDELDPDEPLTAKQMKLLQKKIVSDAQKNIQELDFKYRKSLAAISEKAARLRYKDYDDVLPYAVEMAKQDPLILQKIASSDDPAEEAYQWGLRNPRYLEMVRGKTKKDVADKIKTNLTKNAGTVPNRGKNVPTKDIFEMTPEEFAEYKRKKFGD